MSKTDIQNSEAKKALDYVESQRLDNLQRSVKPIFQPQDPIERERDIAYEVTIPEKKKLLMRMYDLYEAGKKQNQKAYYDLRSEILELVYLIQDDTARRIQQETERRVMQEIQDIANDTPPNLLLNAIVERFGSITTSDRVIH